MVEVVVRGLSNVDSIRCVLSPNSVTREMVEARDSKQSTTDVQILARKKHPSKKHRRRLELIGAMFVFTVAILLVDTMRMNKIGASSWSGMNTVVVATETTVVIDDARARPIDPTAVTMYVVSLQGVAGASVHNSGRLDKFLEEMRHTCGDKVQFKHCPGVVADRRGEGVTRSFIKCFELALRDGSEHPVFFEDDARLFSSDFCAQSNRTEIWSTIPADALAVALGGHHWMFGEVVYNTSETSRGVVHVVRKMVYGLGAYGFMVPRRSLRELRDGFLLDIASNETMLSPDLSWYLHAKNYNKSVYAIEPLAVKHIGAFSNTWNRTRGAIDDRSLVADDRTPEDFPSLWRSWRFWYKLAPYRPNATDPKVVERVKDTRKKLKFLKMKPITKIGF